MTKKNPLSEEDRADLVAYLDGELDAKTARTLEAKLNRDPSIRAEADSLRRTWELLDYLPSPTPSRAFSHQTLHRISAYGGSKWIGVRKSILGAGWAAALILGAWVGYAATARLWPKDRTDRDLAHNLPLIEHKRLYEAVGDMNFLRTLDAPDLFGDESRD